MKTTAANGEVIVRPYTPVSDNSMTGKFQLLIKRYELGKMSRFVHELAIGGVASFKHIAFNIKQQLPFAADASVTSISALTGGTGITPIYQAMQRLAATPGDTTEVTVLYGSKTAADVLLWAELDKLVAESSGRFKVLYILSGGAADWEGLTGRIDAEKIKAHCQPPSDGTRVFVCGVLAMYESLCGPRGEPDVAAGTALAELGYTQRMGCKF